MLTSVPFGLRKIEDYSQVVGEQLISELKKKAETLKGLKVLNISSTAFGGGVAELLYTTAPLMVNLGLDVKWQVINGYEDFFTITKNIHNGLQGMDFVLTEQMIKMYEERNKSFAENLEDEADIIIVHDPQPMAMSSFIIPKKRKKAKWIWRAHVDLSSPQQEVVDYVSKFIPYYDAVIVTLPKYSEPFKNINKPYFIAPTIDPLSIKNKDLSKSATEEIIDRLEIDKNRPIMCQVSRFDPWKDPFGVIDTYRLVKKEIKDLQLLMVASMAVDDPEGWHYFEKTARYAGVDPSINFFSNVTGVGNVEVNAIQRASDVVIQKSKREGFGLVVSEAMWKFKPVVGTKVGGITLQIKDSENGFLIETTEEAAKKVKFLIENKEKAKEMGKKAHIYVKDNFLTPRLLNDWLDIFTELSEVTG
ncbi:MAG: glycosyltransferase [Actinobacteria bacterium]|nr:MAG: glycosyltransferase [Actinomycetota bacterium]